MTKNITFTLPAEALDGATEAYLLGDFNNWNAENAPKLEKQKDGSFKTVAKLEEGKTYHYRFLLNDGRWVNDYNAQSYSGAHGLHVENCVITVPVSKSVETKKAQPVKTAPAKEVKAPVVAKATPVAAKQPAKKVAPAKAPVVAKAAPAKAPAAKATPAKTVKAAAPKATAAKTAKPVAAAKKAAPKAKK